MLGLSVVAGAVGVFSVVTMYPFASLYGPTLISAISAGNGTKNIYYIHICNSMLFLTQLIFLKRIERIDYQLISVGSTARQARATVQLHDVFLHPHRRVFTQLGELLGNFVASAAKILSITKAKGIK